MGGKPFRPICAVPWLVLAAALVACAARCFALEAPAASLRTFESLFGDEVRKTQAKGTPDQRGELAEQIFVDARGRADDPAFVGPAMEAVITLASPVPARAGLVYAAWQSLGNCGLRPRLSCFEQMMTLAPRVLESLDPAARGYWLTEVWLPDVLELAGLYCDAGEYAKARELLIAVRSAAQRAAVAARPDVEDNIRGLERLQSADAVSKAILLARQNQWQAARTALGGITSPGAAELGQALASAEQQKPRAELQTQLTAAATALRLPPLVDRVLRRAFSQAGTDAKGRLVDQAFYGVQMAGASKIVFVIDRSGSMTTKIGAAKEELKRALDSLAPEQVFDVIFFDTAAAEMPGGPVPATKANKQKAREFIDGVGTGGGTNPIEALRIGLQLGPDTLNLLTDGEFDSVVADEIKQLNAGRRTRINTFCFFSQRRAAVLEAIAQQHRGTFKFIGQ